ncbi:MAG: cytochrome c [Pricia sp.]|nr:cytochrome c [Pricia sp.]
MWVRNFFSKSGCVALLGLLMVIQFSSCNSSKKEDKSGSDLLRGDQVRTQSESEKNVDLPIYMVEGGKLYTEHCLTCHQYNGKGVSGLNPPLDHTEYVTGDKERLLKILINGSSEGLVVKGSTYSNVMPPFEALSNSEIAHIASYIRNSFGNTAEPISEEEVAAYKMNTNG